MAQNPVEHRKRLAFAIAEFLLKVKQDQEANEVERESLDFALDRIQQAFHINVESEEEKEKWSTGIPLEKLFNISSMIGQNPAMRSMAQSVLNAAPPNTTSSDSSAMEVEEEKDDFEDKLAEYLEKLRSVGYFKGAEEGSDEEKRRIDRAREKLKTRLEEDKKVREEAAEAKKNEGNALLSERKFEEAIQAYTEAIELNPKNAIYFANRAAAYSHIRDHDNAVKDCNSAIKCDPNYVKAYSRLGLAHFSLKQYPEAVKAYTTALSLEPDNVAVKESLSIAVKKMGESGAGPMGHSHGPGAGGHGHSHNGQPCSGHGHSHGGAGQHAAPQQGGFDFANLLNNPAIQNMAQQFSQGGDTGGLSGILNNPQLMNMAESMMSNPQFQGMLNNPALMNVAQSVMSNPELMSSMMQNFGNMAGNNSGSDGSSKQE